MSSNRKTALVIGAHVNNESDCKRWNAYFADRNTVWCGLPEYIMNGGLNLNYTLEELTQEKSYVTLLRDTISHYQKQYDNYIQTHFIDVYFDTIMLDRFTTHTLVIQNPIDLNDEKGKEYNKEIYALWQSKLLNDGTSEKSFQDGRLNKSILCLLFIKLLRTLKLNGSLIIDTAYIDPAHIEILKKYFNAYETWDFTSAENAVLEYGKGYKNGAYLTPKFVHFKGFYATSINSDEIMQELIESALPEFKFNLPNIAPEKKEEYLAHIKIIFDKAIEITQKAMTDENYLTASKEAKRLHEHLKITADRFFSGKINFYTFKNESKEAITTARLTLDWHRGFWRVILSNIFAAIGQLFDKETKYNFTFFQKTDSSEKLDTLEKKLDELTPTLGQI